MFGLREDDIASIRHILSSYPEVRTGLIFGSRAKGNFKNGSDVDIALKGNDLTFKLILKISTELNEETLMPYHFDVLNYHTIQNEELIHHIDRIGVPFYEQT